MASKPSKDASEKAKDLPNLSGSETVSNTVPETVQNSEVSSATLETPASADTSSTSSVTEKSTVQGEVVKTDAVVNASGANPRMGSFLERLVAYIVDVIIVTVLAILVGFIIGIPLGIISALVSSAKSSPIESGFQLFGWVIGFGITCLYYGYFYSKKGQTPGKMLMKLKVVRAEDLQYVSWGRAIVRETVGSFINAWLFYLGYLWYFMSQKRQTWGDSLVKTYVVKTDDKGEIYMDGPELYEKSAVKTFLPCGCCGLIYLGLIIAVVVAISAGAMALSQSLNKGGSGYPNGNGYQYKYDSNTGDDMLDDYNKGPDINRYYYDDGGSDTVPPLNYDYDMTNPESGTGMGTGTGSDADPTLPDFQNMTEEELNQYLQKQLNMQLQQ